MSDTPGVTLQFPDGRSFGPAPIETIVEWSRQGRIPADAMISEPGSPPVRAGDHPSLAAHCVQAAPPMVPGQLSPINNEGLGRLIPSRNTPALVGYYVGIFAMLPAIFLGPLGVIGGGFAIWLGVKGLRVYKADPSRHGRTHSIVAIVGGVLSVVVGLLFSAVIITAIVSASRR